MKRSRSRDGRNSGGYRDDRYSRRYDERGRFNREVEDSRRYGRGDYVERWEILN